LRSRNVASSPVDAVAKLAGAASPNVNGTAAEDVWGPPVDWRSAGKRRVDAMAADSETALVAMETVFTIENTHNMHTLSRHRAAN
jgi:hypothetical protein